MNLKPHATSGAAGATGSLPLHRQLLRFGAVGVAGLLVDLAVLYVLAPLLGWYAGRVLSFVAAASTTWWLNRRFTFAASPALSTRPAMSVRHEYARYMVSMLGGALVNYSVYVLTLLWIETHWAPALGVALGSLAGMSLNFTAARHFVFGQFARKPREPRRTAVPISEPTADGQRPMRPLQTWPAEARGALIGVFTDIDDTLTTEGAITPDALQALADLRAAGLCVVAITGRPVGWSEPFAASWPVDAIVAENGAVALIPPPPWRPGDMQHRVAGKRYQVDTQTRAANFDRMQKVLARIEREIPGARRATDSSGRETDIAVDHSEFVHLSEAQIDAVVALMRSEGMTATVSSIHINGWYGDTDKLSGARWIVDELWSRDLDEEMGRWAYVGDSTNDQVMFKTFAHSIGVANVARFVPKLTDLPHYVTQGERGAGFAEVARAVLSAR